jgi:hypothetical protein
MCRCMADRKSLVNIKRKVWGEQFSNSEQLKSRVNKDWKKKTCNDCIKMIDDIPKKLGDVIKSGGEQIYTH